MIEREVFNELFIVSFCHLKNNVLDHVRNIRNIDSRARFQAGLTDFLFQRPRGFDDCAALVGGLVAV